MRINDLQAEGYSDLGDLWLHYQIARLRQRHLQCGRHFRLDMIVLLDRLARIAREMRSLEAQPAHPDSFTDGALPVTASAVRVERPARSFASVASAGA